MFLLLEYLRQSMYLATEGHFEIEAGPLKAAAWPVVPQRGPPLSYCIPVAWQLGKFENSLGLCSSGNKSNI